MAPTVASIHKLVAKNAKLAKALWKNIQRHVENRLAEGTRASPAQLQPLVARNTPRQPIHRIAYLKQSKGRWYTTHSSIASAVRRFTSATSSSPAGPNYNKASFSKTKVGVEIGRLSGRAPFASTLRPNLTGGTLGRTAGGYGFGGGSARYFSHGPAAPAQVMHNVSQGIRAFFISGQKAQFDGMNPRTGEMRFKAVGPLQYEVGRKLSNMPRTSPGSFIDFNINPTITALAPLSGITGFPRRASEQETLGSEGLLDVLSVDFSRALKELAATLECLKRLSALGDLPFTYHSHYLRVHFPGCDAETAERLCDELGVFRGVIGQDEDFDSFAGTEIALLFPFAPSKSPSEYSFFARSVSARQERIEWRHMLSPEGDTMSQLSMRSNDGFLDDDFEVVQENPWLSQQSSPSGYVSLHTSDSEEAGPTPAAAEDDAVWVSNERARLHTPLEYQGIEGIYRFMKQCESGMR